MAIIYEPLGRIGGGVEGAAIVDVQDGRPHTLDGGEHIVVVEGVWGVPNVTTPAGSAVVPPGSGMRAWKTSAGVISAVGGGLHRLRHAALTHRVVV